MKHEQANKTGPSAPLAEARKLASEIIANARRADVVADEMKAIAGEIGAKEHELHQALRRAGKPAVGKCGQHDLANRAIDEVALVCRQGASKPGESVTERAEFAWSYLLEREKA